MVRWHQLDLACDLIERHGFGGVAACCHHHAKLAQVDQIGASAAQARRKDSIFRAGRASSLHIAKNGQAGLKMCQFLKLVGQAQCVALMPDLKRGDLSLGLQLLVQGLGAFESLFGYSKDARIVLAHRALGDRHNTEVAPLLAALADGLGDTLHLVGDFGN